MEAVDSQLLERARGTLRHSRFVRHDGAGDSGAAGGGDAAGGGAAGGAGDGAVATDKTGRLVSFSVIERTDKNTVTADLDWGQAPTCTCTSYWTEVRLGRGPWCRHVVAVLVKEEELRCQLIDLLL